MEVACNQNQVTCVFKAYINLEPVILRALVCSLAPCFRVAGGLGGGGKAGTWTRRDLRKGPSQKVYNMLKSAEIWRLQVWVSNKSLLWPHILTTYSLLITMQQNGDMCGLNLADNKFWYNYKWRVCKIYPQTKIKSRAFSKLESTRL